VAKRIHESLAAGVLADANMPVSSPGGQWCVVLTSCGLALVHCAVAIARHMTWTRLSHTLLGQSFGCQLSSIGCLHPQVDKEAPPLWVLGGEELCSAEQLERLSRALGKKGLKLKDPALPDPCQAVLLKVSEEWAGVCLATTDALDLTAVCNPTAVLYPATKQCYSPRQPVLVDQQMHSAQLLTCERCHATYSATSGVVWCCLRS
jgi:hypothetical protein